MSADTRPDEPLYLLTRLLLRRPGRIFPYTSLSGAYSTELGDEGVKRAMRTLSHSLPVPADIAAQDPPTRSVTAKPPISSTSSNAVVHPATPTPVPARSRSDPYPTPLSAKAKGKRRASDRPWADLPTGLSPEEERADPALAEAIRESLWAAKVNRVELDEDGEVVDSPPPERPVGGRSVSNTSISSEASSRAAAPIPSASASLQSAPPPHAAHADFAEEFSLTPREVLPITVLARNETTLSLDEIMSCISAEDLRRVAKARKIPPSLLANREAVTEALRGAAKKQTVLGFAPAKGKGKSRERQAQGTLPFSPSPSGRITSEGLLVAQLLPLIGGHALQLTPELHALVARVNLIFTRIPPVTASSSSLMLPSILVTSRKRRYPDYGPPTRSTVWRDRPELLTWERAVHWEAVVADALGDTWQEQRKNPAPGFGVRREAPNRVEGAKIVKRVWEGVWPVWSELVQGRGAEAVDAKNQQGGLVGDRFQTGQWGLPVRRTQRRQHR